MHLAALHVANLTDARYFSAYEVAWMGFCLDSGSDAYLAPQKIKEIRDWVEGPAIFGEMGTQSPSEIAELVQYCQLDGIVAGMFSDPAALAEIPGLRILQELVVDRSAAAGEWSAVAEKAAPYAEGFVLDLSKNAIRWDELIEGSQPLLEEIRALCRQYRVWLHADWHVHQLPAVQEILAPAGLCIHGGHEIRPGVKNFDDLDEWMETALSL
jgi:phosphoribosylanthranilate isomerase